MASFACNSVHWISRHASTACSTRLTHKIECMMTGIPHGHKYVYILGNLYQYKVFLESHHSPKNTLCVLAMGQICQRRASVGDAPRISAPAEAAPCMPKKHDPKRYANDYSRPKLLGWENEWLFKMPRCNEISWRDLTCSHVMFVLAPTPRTTMNVQCSICSKSPCNYMFHHFLGVFWSLMHLQSLAGSTILRIRMMTRNQSSQKKSHGTRRSPTIQQTNSAETWNLSFLVVVAMLDMGFLYSGIYSS